MEKLRPDDAVAVAVPESAGENPPPVVPGKSGGGDEYGGNVFAESAEPQQQHTRVLVPTESTVPPRVLWRKENRSYTDKIWGIVYALSFVAFLSCGFFLVANSKPRYEHDSQGNRVISSHFRSDVESCCEGATSRDSFGFDLCSKLEQEEASGARRLQAGDSKYDGDEGIFDAFMEAPEIIVGLLAFAAFTALVWVLLLRFFSRPIVILTEVIKVGVFIYMGVVQESTGTRVFCFFIAAGIIAYDVWVSILCTGSLNSPNSYITYPSSSETCFNAISVTDPERNNVRCQYPRALDKSFEGQSDNACRLHCRQAFLCPECVSVCPLLLKCFQRSRSGVIGNLLWWELYHAVRVRLPQLHRRNDNVPFVGIPLVHHPFREDATVHHCDHGRELAFPS